MNNYLEIVWRHREDTFIRTAGLQNEISTQDLLYTKLYCNTNHRGEDISKHFAYSDGNIEIRERQKKTKKKEIMAEKNERHGRIASNPVSIRSHGFRSPYNDGFS